MVYKIQAIVVSMFIAAILLTAGMALRSGCKAVNTWQSRIGVGNGQVK